LSVDDRGTRRHCLGIAKITGIGLRLPDSHSAIGNCAVPPLVRWFSRIDLPGTSATLGIMLAFGLAWLASAAGSAMIIGAFAAGLFASEDAAGTCD